MTKITIHWQKMQYHKIPKCRVSFMTWSWAFSVYDNWVPVDWTSIEVPVWTTLSYDGWVQWVAFAFYIWNKSYTVYERNWYSWTKKYLEWITIDWDAFTKWTYTITWDTEIDALWVRNGISINFTLSPNPWHTPPLAPIVYPSWVLVNRVALNYNWYAAIIWFDEWESILVPEQQWYESTWTSVSVWTALSADTIITVYLEQLVTCNVVELQSMSIPSNEFTQTIESYVLNNYSFIKQIQQWRAPNNWNMIYTFYDSMFHMVCSAVVTYLDRNWQLSNTEIVTAFSTDRKWNAYCSIYDREWHLYDTYWVRERPSNLVYIPNIWADVYQSNTPRALDTWVSDWNCWDTCWLIQTIYNLATNK